MKELSIEQKARRYDEVVNEIKNLRDMLLKEGVINKDGVICDNFNRIFPELKESEDERIRKAIIKHFRQGTTYTSFYGFSKEQVIAYLEKQKAIDVLDEEEREFADNVDSYRKEVDAAYQTGYNEGVKATLEKQDKQKPAWSEEDEMIIIQIGDAVEDYFPTTVADKIKSWLKDRYTWKPSEEQMDALKDALNDAIWQYDFKGSLIKEEVTRKHAETIESLYNDLKKLKGE